jgi:hypothetical protein
LHKKQKQLEKDINILTSDADKQCEKAEKEQNLTLLAKANAMRKSAHDKQHALKISPFFVFKC